MDTTKSPCYVCGFPCRDWNALTGGPSNHFLNVCALHNPDDKNRENGFTRDSYEGKVVLALKIQYDKLAKEARVETLTYPEIGCITCSRMNDVGNPKIKSCWFCTSPVNYDG